MNQGNAKYIRGMEGIPDGFPFLPRKEKFVPIWGGRALQKGSCTEIDRTEVEPATEETYHNDTTSNPKLHLLPGQIKPIVVSQKQEEEQCKGRLPKTNLHKSSPESRPLLPPRLKKQHVLHIADNVISLLIIGPLVIGYWRGVWGLMDFYNLPFSGWICCLLGTSLHYIFTILREILHKTFAINWRLSNPIGRAGYTIIRLVYTYIFAVSCIMQWRGGWMMLNSMMGENEWAVAGSTGVFLAILLALKLSRNLLAPPFIVIADTPSQIFIFSTRYRIVSRE